MNRIKLYENKIINFFILLGVISFIMGIYQCVYLEIRENSYIWAYKNTLDKSTDEGIYQTLNGEDIIRFHVLANSDSEKDQRIKLQVRDIVINEITNELKDVDEVSRAKKILKNEKSSLSSKIRAFFKEQGYNYEVKTKIEKKYFPTRRYENGALEGDKYIAFKVIIGEGKGENWWCVLFPPLCYVDLAVRQEMKEDVELESEKKLEQADQADIEEKDKEIKFFIFDWIKDLF